MSAVAAQFVLTRIIAGAGKVLPASKMPGNVQRAFMNGGRSALFSSVATAIAILVVVFGLAAALKGLGSAAQLSIFEGSLIGEISARLPVTLEPVFISFIIASALGFVLTLPSTPVFRGAVAVVVTGLQSLPLFMVATVAIFVFLRAPHGSCPAPCTFGRQLGILVMPVAVLLIYQLPFLVEFFDKRRARAEDARVVEASTVSGLATLFADSLPSLVSVAMIGEIIYGWAGEGRWLGIPDTLSSRNASAFTLFLIFNALVVLVIRCVIEFFVQRHRAVTDVGE